MIMNSQEAEERGLQQVAELMCLAARTAPKGRGIDNLLTMIVDGPDKEPLIQEMNRLAQVNKAEFFTWNANALEHAAKIVLLATPNSPLGIPGCGYCGFGDCAGLRKAEGVCAMNIGDLGIAVSSALGVAALHHVDNRLMFSIGRAAINLKSFPQEVVIAYGLPLSASGKNPFFDRKK